MAESFEDLEQLVLARCGVEATPRSFDVGGRQVRVLVAGEGPAVVLVPGGGMPAAAWAPLMAELDGYRQLALDLPGFGRSDPLDLSNGDLRKGAVSFLQTTLDGLGVERATLIGSSMGGLWSLWLALDRPERVSAVVTLGCPALILGTSAPLPMRLMSVRGVGPLMMKLQPPSVRQVERALGRIGIDLSRFHELRDLVVAMERLPGTERAWLDLLAAALRLRGARPEVSLTADQLAQINQPTQFIWGRNDPFGDAEVGERAAELVLHAEFHLVPGGHSPWLPDSGHVADLVKGFITRHCQPEAKQDG